MAYLIFISILILFQQVEALPLTSSSQPANVLVLGLPILAALAVCFMVTCCDCSRQRCKRRIAHELNNLESDRDEIAINCRISGDIWSPEDLESPPPPPYSNGVRRPHPERGERRVGTLVQLCHNGASHNTSPGSHDVETPNKTPSFPLRASCTAQVPESPTAGGGNSMTAPTSAEDCTERCYENSVAASRARVYTIAMPAAARIKDGPFIY